MATRFPDFQTALVGVPLPLSQGWTNIAIIPGIGGTVTVATTLGSIVITNATVFGGGGSNNGFNNIWGAITITATGVDAQIIVNGDISFQTPPNNVSQTVNPLVPLVDAPVMDLIATKQGLSTSSTTAEFTISYLGDDITLRILLGVTNAVFTFPSNALCVSEGVPSNNNLLTLSGAVGDFYIVQLKKIIRHYVVAKNFGQPIP